MIELDAATLARAIREQKALPITEAALAIHEPRDPRRRKPAPRPASPGVLERTGQLVGLGVPIERSSRSTRKRIAVTVLARTRPHRVRVGSMTAVAG